MICQEIYGYLNTVKGLPFFYFTGDMEYMPILSELKQVGIDVIRISDFCTKEDRFPDVDSFIDCLRTLDIDYKNNKFVVIGLGEYLALRGIEETKQLLRRLKNTTLGNARVILLLRGITAQGKELVSEDTRLVAKELVCFSENTNSNITIINNKLRSAFELKFGIKNLLYKLEEGQNNNVEMNSDLSFENSIISISELRNAFSAFEKMYKGMGLKENFGNEEQWDMLWKMYTTNPDKILSKLTHYLDYEQDIYNHLLQEEFKNWLFFLNLKLFQKHIRNKYLSYVVNRTNSSEELKDNILNEITKIPHNFSEFKELYEDRKLLVKNFPESEIAIFISENKIDATEEIYKYTDNTILERREIVGWVSENGWIDEIENIYPALGMYLKPYIFNCGSLSQILTEYFSMYKFMKVENRISEEFMNLVLKYGKEYTYTKLGTRDSAINKIVEKKSTYLYWIDALGVEYLSYIVALVKERGLSITIDIARADLPTITSVNKSFYENWNGLKKYKEEDLDDIKHKEKGGFFYTEEQKPVHLVKELDVIKKALDNAKTLLAMHECKQFVIASDHGASRLAVIRKEENLHPTDTQGEHSGRCCKVYEEENRDYVVEENGFFVRSDYGRYKGSRAANVEVHGGASLEEVVVPIITLRLKNQTEIDIRIINSDNIIADRHNGTLVELYISDVDNPQNVYLIIEGTKYVAIAKDKCHYSVALPDIKRQKKCDAEIYDGDTLIGNVRLVVKGRTASVNTDFDDLF